jgi:hypothetical protein
LSRPQKVAVGLLTTFAICCHPTNWLVALLLCGLLAVRPRRRWMWAAFGAATFVHITLMVLVYHRVQLFPPRPAFLLARFMENGLLPRYFQEHVAEAQQFALWQYRDQFPLNRSAGVFLFEPQGLTRVLERLNPVAWETILAQELPLTERVVSAYPAATATLCAQAWLTQIFTFKPAFDIYCHPLAYPDMLRRLPHLAPVFHASRQFQGEVDLHHLDNIEEWAFIVAILLLLLRPPQGALRSMTVFLVVGLLLNAGLTANISCVDERFQARVEWLVPYVAMLRVVELAGRRKPSAELGQA